MTTSPAPARAETFQPDPIGWLFIQKYYEVFTKEINTIYQLYDKNASIAHEKFPGSSSQKTVYQAKGTDAIKSHFKSQSEDDEKNRIVITSADFQLSQEKNILIVVFGEWAKGDSAYWQFTHTFLLTPSKETVYDVANDILKFIDFADFKHQPATVIKTEATPEPVKEEPEEVAEVPVEAPVEPENGTVTPSAEEPEEQAPESEEATVSAPEVSESEESKGIEASSEPRATSSSVPLSWADLAAKEPPKSAKAPTTPAPKSASGPTPAVKKPSPPTTAPPQAQSNGKYKKEDWFPIYIRNVEIDTEVLKEALIKQFGAIKFFKRNLRIVLCDFETKEDQEAALKAKQIKIGDNVISLEPREVRDTKYFAKADPKRKNEKKQNGKKKPTKN